ncbi:MAG: hypothetical protein DRP74_02705 [Candidatus Omnitrophota bacterium]|nr:MAG: hypothetical protein DRP74_02705 [Candidatus Omnitrophota bacterium]
MSRIINYTCTLADTWYKVFDESDYRKNPIQEIKVKLREGTTADHFRYAYTASPSTWMTSTSGFVVLKNVKKLYVYIPDTAGIVVEIEILYK